VSERADVCVIPPLTDDQGPSGNVGALLRFDYSSAAPQDADSDAADKVDLAAEETFPASDPPAW
jgi:hypothetical protein